MTQRRESLNLVGTQVYCDSEGDHADEIAWGYAERAMVLDLNFRWPSLML